MKCCAEFALVAPMFIRDNHRQAKIFGIGSLLDGLTSSKRSILASWVNRYHRPKVSIWSSGFIAQELLEGEILKRRVNKVFAVRGKYSRDRLEKLTKKNLQHVPLGDGGLLANFLLDKIPEKKYSIGIIPHHVDFNTSIVDRLKCSLSNAILINVLDDPIEVINRIAECDVIISSAMHGLIVSDSLGIPNKWIKISDNLTGGNYKFKDYYSVYDLEPEPWDLRKRVFTDIDVELVSKNYEVKFEQVKTIQKNLMNAKIIGI